MATQSIERIADEAQLTPVMRQYFAAKQAHPDCLMFCRIGDFYELFYEDAITVARELQLTLTARDREKKQPMCGVPYHAAEIYLQRLLRKGYRIALCEQMEDPKTVKGIVKREVTRVLTPGTAVDPGLGAGESCWLAALVVGKSCVGLALVDLSTGDFRATEFSGANAWTLAVDELNRLRPVELIYAGGGLLGASAVLLPDMAASADSSVTGLEGIRTHTPVEDWVLTAEHSAAAATAGVVARWTGPWRPPRSGHRRRRPGALSEADQAGGARTSGSRALL
jgi:DNA mismatch repair protein MutS